MSFKTQQSIILALVVAAAYCYPAKAACYVDDYQTCTQIAGYAGAGCSDFICDNLGGAFHVCLSSYGTRNKSLSLNRVRSSSNDPSVLQHPDAKQFYSVMQYQVDECVESEACVFFCVGAGACDGYSNWTDYGGMYDEYYASGADCGE